MSTELQWFANDFNGNFLNNGALTQVPNLQDCNEFTIDENSNRF